MDLVESNTSTYKLIQCTLEMPFERVNVRQSYNPVTNINNIWTLRSWQQEIIK